MEEQNKRVLCLQPPPPTNPRRMLPDPRARHDGEVRDRAFFWLGQNRGWPSVGDKQRSRLGSCLYFLPHQTLMMVDLGGLAAGCIPYADSAIL